MTPPPPGKSPGTWPSMPDAFFDEQVALVDTELATLKRILEAGA
ncbi:hypothetical protein ACIQUQ_05575 [Streptomyces sp. NPDC101118]